MKNDKILVKDYDKILGKLSKIINSDFDMQSLRELKEIYIYMNRVYRYELMKASSNERLCAITYEKYLNYINDVVLAKLKEELGFEDEVIKRIFSYIKTIDLIEDIYVLDGNVIVKYNNSNGTQYVSPEMNFTDITSSKFVQGHENNFDTNFVTMSINNVVKSTIDRSVEPEDILEFSNGKINYNVPNLRIYASNNTKDIFTDRTGSKITKILVIYENELFYYDMKIRDEYVILSQNDCIVYSLSDILNQNEKQKKKIRK